MSDLSRLSDDELLRMLQQTIQSKPSASADTDKWAAGIKPDDPGAVGAAMVMAGRGLERIGRGAQQLYYGATGNQPELDRLKAAEAESRGITGPLKEQRPIAAAVGEMLPYAAVPASWGVLPAAGAVAGLEGLKYGSAKERALGAAEGGASALVGGLVGKAIGGAIAPSRGALTPAQQEALTIGQNLGIQPRLSQATGSQFAARLEDMAARTPGGAGVMRSFADANQQAMNRAAARSIGETADDLGSKVIADASDRIGAVFNELTSLGPVQVGSRQLNPIVLGQKVGDAADDVLRTLAKRDPSAVDPALKGIAERAKALAKNGGRIDGETYKLARSDLTNAMFDAKGVDKTLYGKLLESLDSAADTSLRMIGRSDLAEKLAPARAQYGNLMTLVKGTTIEGGNVSPARVASTLRTNNPKGFRAGDNADNPLVQLAKYGEAFKPLQAGSPTFERSVVSNPLSTTVGAAYSWPIAQAVTSPALTWYPRRLGGTAAAAQAGLLGNYAGRGTGAGLSSLGLERLGLLAPVMAE